MVCAFNKWFALIYFELGFTNKGHCSHCEIKLTQHNTCIVYLYYLKKKPLQNMA